MCLLVNVGFATSRLYSSFLGFGQFQNVAVHGILCGLNMRPIDMTDWKTYEEDSNSLRRHVDCQLIIPKRLSDLVRTTRREIILGV